MKIVKMVSLLQEKNTPESDMFEACPIWDVSSILEGDGIEMIDERLIKNDEHFGGFHSGSTDSNHREGHAVTYICQACSIKTHGSAWNVVLCSNISDLYH